MESNAEVDQARNLVDPIFVQAIRLLGALISSPDKAQRSMQVIDHLVPNHFLGFPLGESGEAAILS